MNPTTGAAVAGLLATAPMSAVMIGLRSLLPRREQYALPPHEITGVLAAEAGAAELIDEPPHYAFTALSHLGYGAVAAIPYVLAERRIDAAPLTKGMMYGGAVWAASYLGWLPAAGILRPATEHPPRRTLMMVLSHLVWGASLALVWERLSRQRR